MELNDRDPLWQLLGKAKKNEPSPWLHVTVLGKIREEKEPHQSSWRQWLRPLSIAFTCIAILGGSFLYFEEEGHLQEKRQQLAIFNAFEAFTENQLESDVLWLADSR